MTLLPPPPFGKAKENCSGEEVSGKSGEKLKKTAETAPASDELNQTFNLQRVSKRAVKRNKTFLHFGDNVGVNTAEK